jgi:hypothetical protein
VKRTLGFRHAVVTLSERHVLTGFPDGTCAVLDVQQGDNDFYRGHAGRCGYGDWRRYARHHDLVHTMLADLALDAPSPTLWSAAHGLAGDHWHEEQQVNTVQWTWATGSRYRFGSLGAWYGPRWRAMLAEICQKLEDIA